MKRDQFTFYRSYYEALKHLSKRDRADVLMAVIGYALDEEEPKLSGVPLSVFTLIRPVLDTGRNKAKNRLNKLRTNEEQNRKEGEGEKEREEEREIEGEGDIPPKPPCAAVFSAYANKINPTPSERCLGELRSFAETMGEDCCLRAIDIACDERKTNWSYIRAILRNKMDQGVRCLADWDALEDKRKGEKTGDDYWDRIAKIR